MKIVRSTLVLKFLKISAKNSKFNFDHILAHCALLSWCNDLHQGWAARRVEASFLIASRSKSKSKGKKKSQNKSKSKGKNKGKDNKGRTSPNKNKLYNKRINARKDLLTKQFGKNGRTAYDGFRAQGDSHAETLKKVKR